MQQIIQPSGIGGKLQAPPSKSEAQRAIAIAALAGGVSHILGSGDCQDVQAGIRIVSSLARRLEENEDLIIIHGGLREPGHVLDCGESGLGMRLFSAIAALLPGKVTLTGRGSLMSRPMFMVCDALKALGAHCESQGGYAPLTVKGPLRGGDIVMDASISSQMLTGILIAGPCALSPLHIRVKNLKSKPYVDLTLQAMRAFGVEVEHHQYEEFFIPAPAAYSPARFHVEGDWSGASFFLVAAAIAGSICVTNLRKQSLQADRAILGALDQCGASVVAGEDSVQVSKNQLKAFHFDATHCPDLFPPLVALGAHCQGVSRIAGVHRLFAKESDRAIALQQEFAKMGISVIIENDTMLVKGGKPQRATVHSHYDHRIAMACAVAALGGEGRLTIMDPAVVDKSYPGFFSDFQSVCITS